MENYRKLIKFGTSSYVVSLPNEWIKKNNLKKGDSLFINESLNSELIFTPKPISEDVQNRELVISVDGKDISRVKREIVSAYINNYDIIKIQGNVSKYGREIRDAIKNLMALEIIDERSNEIIAKDYLDLKDVTFDEIIRKIDTITKSMMGDAKTFGNEKLHENIAERDEQINRLVYLIIRTLRFTLDNPGRANKKNILRMTPILNVWDVSLNIEKVADDIKRSARHFYKIRSKTKVLQSLIEILADMEKFYWETMKAYYNCDVEKAFSLSSQKRKLSERCNQLHEKHWGEKYVPTILENFKNMISSIHNIGRRIYS